MSSFFDENDGRLTPPPSTMSAASVLGFDVDGLDEDAFFEQAANDLWIERISVYKASTWRKKPHIVVRPFYVNNRTGEERQMIPQEYASNVVPASPEEHEAAERKRQRMQLDLEKDEQRKNTRKGSMMKRLFRKSSNDDDEELGVDAARSASLLDLERAQEHSARRMQSEPFGATN